jgi:hypothetical protein
MLLRDVRRLQRGTLVNLLNQYRVVPLSFTLPVLFVLCAACATTRPYYVERAEDAADDGDLARAFAIYHAALVKIPTEAETLRPRRQAMGLRWAAKLLEDVKAKRNAGDLTGAYARWHQIAGFVKDNDLGSRLNVQLQEARRELAAQWIMSRLPDAQLLHKQGKLEPAYALVQALELERQRAGVGLKIVPELATLPSRVDQDWSAWKLSTIWNYPSLKDEELRLATLLAWKKRLASVSWKDAALSERLGAEIRRLTKSRLALAHMLGAGHTRAAEVVEKLVTAPVDDPEVTSYWVELRGLQNMLHEQLAALRQKNEYSRWFHKNAADRADSNRPDRAQWKAVLEASTRLTWKVRLSGKPCEPVTRSLASLPRSGEIPIDLDVDVAECIAEYRTLLLLPSGTNGSVTGVPTRHRCETLTDCFTKDPGLSARLAGRTPKRIVPRAMVGMVATLKYRIGNWIHEDLASLNGPDLDDRVFVKNLTRTALPASLASIQVDIGDRLLRQVLEVPAKVLPKDLIADAMAALKRGDGADGEDKLVMAALMQGALSPEAIEHFTKAYSLTPSEVEDFTFGRKSTGMAKLPDVSSSLFEPPGRDWNALAEIEGPFGPLPIPDVDLSAMAPPVIEPVRREPVASRKLTAVGLRGLRFARPGFSDQSAGYLGIELFVPMLLAESSDRFGFAFKMAFAPGATSSGVALDSALGLGASVRGSDLTLSAVFGAAIGILDLSPMMDREVYLRWSGEVRLRARLATGFQLEASYERRASPFVGLVTPSDRGENHILGRAIVGFGHRSFVEWGLMGRYSTNGPSKAVTLALEAWF